MVLSLGSDTEIVERIFNLDARMRYCAVGDSDEQALEGGMKEDLSSLEGANQNKAILTRCALDHKNV